MRVSCVLLAWVASYPTTPLPVLHVVIGFLPGSGLPFTSVVPKYTFIYFIYLAYRLRKLICFCKHRTNILGPQNSDLMYNPPPPFPPSARGKNIRDKISHFQHVQGVSVKYTYRKTSVRFRFGSTHSSKAEVCGHCLVTLSLTIVNKVLKWLSLLPISILESFLRWQYSIRYSLPLFSTYWDLGPHQQALRKQLGVERV